MSELEEPRRGRALTRSLAEHREAVSTAAMQVANLASALDAGDQDAALILSACLRRSLDALRASEAVALGGEDAELVAALNARAADLLPRVSNRIGGLAHLQRILKRFGPTAQPYAPPRVVTRSRAIIRHDVPAVTNQTADRGWVVDDDVVRLRVLGEDRTFTLPASGEWRVGAAAECELRLVDPTGQVSRQHAVLSHDGTAWTIRDLASTNGIRQDGELRLSFQLAPGVEIGIGEVTLIAESERLGRLRAVLARVIGWGAPRAAEVDRGLRAIREMATLRAALVLCGAGDLSGVARRTHELALGAHPFVVCGPDGRADLARAEPGMLVVAAEHAPRDFRDIAAELVARRSKARLVVCAPSSAAAAELVAKLKRTTTIELPALAGRRDELDRLLEAYAADAVVALGAAGSGFREHELRWLRELPLASLDDVKDVTHRLVALRNWGVTGGAARLGISHVALSRWASRRKIPT